MYVYTEMISKAAKSFAALGLLAEAGHFVSVVTDGGRIIATTSATQFEMEQALAAVK